MQGRRSLWGIEKFVDGLFSGLEVNAAPAPLPVARFMCLRLHLTGSGRTDSILKPTPYIQCKKPCKSME